LKTTTTQRLDTNRTYLLQKPMPELSVDGFHLFEMVNWKKKLRLMTWWNLVVILSNYKV